MKRFAFIYSVLIAALFCACSKDIAEEITVGSIAGSVSDKTTGEPVPTVNVALAPGGKSTVTGSDGTFSFLNLDEQEYTLSINKEGYKPNNTKVTVHAGDPTAAHLLIERIPAIVTADRDSLSFGLNASLNTLSFNIVNTSYEDLEWEIEERCEWITEIKPQKGVLKYGKTEAIVVVIDREKLDSGLNEAVIVVRSSNGSSEVKITATGVEKYAPKLNTLEATDITSSSAKFNGEILDTGVPAYKERGFVYSLTTMPTIKNTIAKLTSPVTKENKYSYDIKGLKLSETYYVRAYAINTIDTAYSTNEVKVSPVASSAKLTMKDVTNLNVSKASATFNGIVTDAGDPAYYERGFVYSKNSNPTISNVKIKANGTGTGAFSANTTGLELDQRYYVRAYATSKVNNSDQTVYSSEESTFMIATTAPQVSIQDASNLNVSAKTATLNGTVDKVGDPAYFERGFVYSTTSNPTTSNTKVKANGSGAGAFSANITGLQHNQKYYVRAYAINKVGEKEQTAYSTGQANFTLTTTATALSVQDVSNLNVTAGTATFNGTITNAGTPAYTERGFVYGTTRNPTTSDKKLVASGSGTGTFSVNASNLEKNTTYYVRAYAICSTGTVYSSSDISFKLKTVAPQVTIQDATNVDVANGSATLNGSIANTGEPPYTERGFVYGLYSNPTLSDNYVAVSGSGTGTFRTNVTGLSLDRTYYVRAYAKNISETVYSSEITVSTKAILPKVSTLEVTDANVSAGTATFRGSVTSAGTPAYIERGFAYSTMPNPTIYDNKLIANGAGVTGSFSTYATGLPTKGYYVRAYATNRGGTVYGEEYQMEPEWIELPVAGIAVQKTDIGYGYWNDINNLCENSIVGGYSDWRLPTLSELSTIYLNRNIIGEFYETINPGSWYGGYYWTSTRLDNGCYNYISFVDGSIYYSAPSGYKNSGRCVRTVKY